MGLSPESLAFQRFSCYNRLNWKGDSAMQLRKIADAVGVGKYPAVLDDIYFSMAKTNAPACDILLIDHLQKEYNIFEEFYDVVRRTAEIINQDENRSAWVKTCVEYATNRPVSEAAMIPAPKADGTQISALLPLYILLPQIPLGIQKYKDRGFSNEEIHGINRGYAAGIRIVCEQTGMPGVNGLYYWWLSIFAKAVIFETCGLQFELRTLPEDVVYLKNKLDGTVIPVMSVGTYHGSGIQNLGCPGYEDPEGSFRARFGEDKENYYGHGAFNSVVDTEEKAFPKSLWACVAGPGDGCMSIHIPRNADISRETLDKAVESAYAIVKERYPEYDPKVIFGSSWILDPKLQEFVGPNSKITGLQKAFCTYPQKCDGKGLFGYVFPKNYESLETLPEDTSLQRKLKQFYMDGGYIYDYAGAIVK